MCDQNMWLIGRFVVFHSRLVFLLITLGRNEAAHLMAESERKIAHKSKRYFFVEECKTSCIWGKIAPFLSVIQWHEYGFTEATSHEGLMVIINIIDDVNTMALVTIFWIITVKLTDEIGSKGWYCVIHLLFCVVWVPTAGEQNEGNSSHHFYNWLLFFC